MPAEDTGFLIEEEFFLVVQQGGDGTIDGDLNEDEIAVLNRGTALGS